MSKQEGYFYENEQGNTVFTEQFHLERGYCCENNCKHCPYRVESKDISGNNHKSMETGELIISKEARERALGYMKLKKSQCQGHAEYSEQQEQEAEERNRVIAQNGNDGIHYDLEEEEYFNNKNKKNNEN